MCVQAHEGIQTLLLACCIHSHSYTTSYKIMHIHCIYTQAGIVCQKRISMQYSLQLTYGCSHFSLQAVAMMTMVMEKLTIGKSRNV